LPTGRRLPTSFTTLRNKKGSMQFRGMIKPAAGHPLLAYSSPEAVQTTGTVAVIAVQSPVEFSYFLAVGENLSFVHCPNDSLAGVLLSHLPQVVSERRCLMIEGRATFCDIAVLYRSALYPLSEDGVAIDHVLGAANYRRLGENERLIMPLIRTKWL
jgi:hypothetical protein